MEIDQLKEIWEKDQVTETPEISVENQEKLNDPLKIVQRNLRWEFWSMIPVFPVVLYILYRTIQNQELLMYAVALVVVAMMVCAFYVVKIYRFYRGISSHQFSSYQHLLELEYKIKYYRDLYQSYYVAFVPILLCEYFLIMAFGKGFQHTDFQLHFWTLIISLVFCLVSLFLIWKLCYHYFYGIHFKKIRELIKQIR
ncbi:hypothetical protein MTP09_06630 [Chryseobacterium suipulveris]|uniref:Uncharacterized protein n=1 Tax=Chryseobacterium suipulveris TaxID=2929800 RepID=A0ABY4BSY2_9FLAO|nr:hypothetical protein [Chryseobacterium suipulveris]UOE42305.1 hypothetical protein MTP09_06630 [Chryseobacterium suipulveris]